MPIRTKKLFRKLLPLFAAAGMVLPTAIFAAGDVPSVAMFGGIFGDATLAQIIIRLVQLFFGLLGFIALVFLLYAGFTWMTAAGDPEKVLKAKRMIQQVVVGLIIIASAFAITSFIYDRFGPPGGGGGDGGGGGGSGGGTFEYYSNYPPEISYVDPALDVKGNTNRSRLVALETSDDIANGAPGNYVSIIGRYFGSAAGKVYFVNRSNNTKVQANLAPCANAWSGNLIIALVPAGLEQVSASRENQVSSSPALKNYDIIVEKLSTTETPLQSNAWGFQVNRVERPGICSMTPNHGAYPSTTTLSGFKFPLVAPRNIVWNVSPNVVSSTGSLWSSSTAVDVIPRDLAGRSLVSVFNGESYSNSFLFMVSAGRLGDPCGYDTTSCREDITTCSGSTELGCQYCSTDPTQPNYQENCDTRKNCTCQLKSAESCTYNSSSTLNSFRACSTGGCSGFEYCSDKSVWSRSCQFTDTTCIPFLGNSSSIAGFSWAFSALKKPMSGMSCLSDIWSDGTCDINGCIDSQLGCDFSSSTEEWIEIYNPTNDSIDLSNWNLRYKDNSQVGGETLYANLSAYGSIPSRDYIIVANSAIRLPALNASLSLNSQSSQIDAVTYGVDNLSSAFSPASIGRKADGADTDNPNDFTFLTNSTAGLTNNARLTATTTSDHLVINELSLAHDACTCVPKTQLCSRGVIDNTTCPTLGSCKQVRTCQDSGHWGSCTQANPACIPYPQVPASTIAAFSWSFGANNSNGDAGPMIVKSCDGSIDCSKNRLPSPSPWSGWTTDELSSIENEKACLNSEIYGRFTQAMDSATLSTSTIRLYVSSTTGWIDQTDAKVHHIEPLLSEGDGGSVDSFAIRLKLGVDLDASSIYRVFVSKQLRDETGRNLIDNSEGARQDLCNEDWASPTSTPGVCWSFVTRAADAADKICQIGCVNCGPNKYFNRYYGEDKQHKVTPISLDNSCISLNNQDYAWDWSEQEQGFGGVAVGGWSLQKIFDAAFSWLTNPMASNGVGIGSQLAQTITTGYGTSTAYKESRWRTYAEYESWFESDDFDYFGIEGQVKATAHYGICEAHNNFTDPVVIENQYCTRTSSSTNAEYGKQILQSPSPWKGQQDACRNAAIFVMFSRNMWNDSLMNADGSVNNFEVYKCSTSSAATSSVFTTDTSKCVQQNTAANKWTAHVFNHISQNMTMQDLISAPASVTNSINKEGVRIIPPPGTELDANSWYRIVIRGGNGGVRGGTSSPETAEGVLRVPSKNAQLKNSATGETWYYWYFKTGLNDCPIDQVAVLPQFKFMPAVGEVQGYTADPFAANCNHLNPYSYNWKWDSLINVFDRCNNPDSGDYVATVCSQTAENCINATEPDYPDVKAFSQNEGATNITAAARQGECNDYKFGVGALQVGYGGFKVIKNSNTNCLNTDIFISFSQDARSTSLYNQDRSDKNVRLYECADATCQTLGAQKGLDIIYPQNSGTNQPNPFFANRAYLVPAAGSQLTAGKSYRAIVQGGPAGVKSAGDTSLIDLNYRSFNNDGGEACDPDLYPWRSGDPEAGTCDADTCKLTGSLCNKKTKQCDPAKDILCDANCQKIGNDNNLASCGNGITEPSEDCDDGNIDNGDGCSSRCLLEGSNNRNNAVCGNARMERGEQCDDGNINNNDGCSNSCKYEVGYAKAATSTFDDFNCGVGTTKATTTVLVANRPVVVKSACRTPGQNGCDSNCLNTGSTPRAPICGNGKIEAGEQCDDGAGSNVNGNRCSARCLLSGSTGAICGDGKLQNSQFDSYSWTFTLGATAPVCRAINFDLNPCPNGVWSITADSSVDKLSIQFYKGNRSNTGGCMRDADMQKIGFWRRIFNTIVRIIKSFLGFRSVVAADWWCPINSEAEGTFDRAALDKMRLGNYEDNIAIDGASAEVLGYSDDSDSNKINFIPQANWTTSTEYKAVVKYERLGLVATSTAGVTTFNSSCQIDKVKYDVWPRGLTKINDAFFCASDPDGGKPDECGRFSDSLYDDDMSAPWTKDYPGNGYNLGESGSTDVSELADYMPGNQHLYRVWPIDVNGYVVRGTDFAPELFNLGTETTNAPVNNTAYAGDFWITSGFKQGRDFFDVTVSDSIDLSAGVKGGSLPIYTFFCNNPWPDPQNFPFIDSAENCKAGTGECINTNFGTFYCRDSGVRFACVAGDTDKIGQACASNRSCYKNPPANTEGSCQIQTADDLPSIANYNAETQTFGSGTGVVTGNLGDNCATLPPSFEVKTAFYNASDTLAYLWGKDGTVYRGKYYSIAGTANAGWQKVDKGAWQKKGLPANFSPVVGYSFNDIMYVWDSAGRYLKWDGLEWKTANKGDLPSNFRPTVGYVFRSGMNDVRIELWDANGIYKKSNADGTIWTDGVKPDSLPNFKAVAGYSYSVGPAANNIQIWDASGLYKVSDGTNWIDGINTNLISGFKPTIGFFDGNTVVIRQGTKAYLWGGLGWSAVATTDKLCDNKLKEFLFTGGRSQSVIYGSSTLSNGTVGLEFAKNDAEGSVTTNFGYNTGQQDFVYNLNLTNDGSYYINLETANDGPTNLPAGFNGSYGSCQQGRDLQGNQLYHQILVSVDGLSTSSIKVLAGTPANHQLSRLTRTFDLLHGQHKIIVRFLNDCSCPGVGAAACANGPLDSNLKLYNISLTDAGAANVVDAIGMRMYNNNNHYSPELWYKTRFNPSSQGNLEKLNIDGYSGATEGRTTYVNAADFSDNHGSVYSDMYLLSYNQGASQATQNIHSQMAANWFFNAGPTDQGGLESSGALGYCSIGGANAKNLCYSDVDCLKRDAGFCKSYATDGLHNADKVKITRDAQRLADVQDIYAALSGYYSSLRCSNDFSRACKVNSECFGGGACGNFYPNLRAGSYITGKTFSNWPSWQDNLAKDLGDKLPVDPINKFWVFNKDAVGNYILDVPGNPNTRTLFACAEPFNAVTCWDQTAKLMANIDGQCSIHKDSAVYAYYAGKSGVSAKVYIKGEFSPTGGYWRPNWNLVANFSDKNNPNYNPFDGYNSLISDNQFCTTVSDTCGNGQADAGETCSNCPLDKGCGLTESCQKNNAGAWACARLTDCGNNIKQPGEECDDGNMNSNDGCSGCVAGDCSKGCELEPGYRANGRFAVPICKDGFKTPSEDCEFANGKPTCGTASAQGQLCCTDQCKFADWYKNPPVNRNPICGDGLRTDQEECDCGATSVLGTYNPFTCSALNSVFQPTYTTNPVSALTDNTFCDTNCRRHDYGNFSFCGDKVWDRNGSTPNSTFLSSNEECDLGLGINGASTSTGCTIDCQCDTANGFVCTGGTPVRCGNSLVDVGETCDLGASNGNGASGCTGTCSCDQDNDYICPGGIPTLCGNNQDDPGEICDKSLDPNCNDTCTGPKNPLGGCNPLTQCCWIPSDNVCSNQCGELPSTPPSCSADCRQCNPADSCCNNSTCTLIPAGSQDTINTSYATDGNKTIFNIPTCSNQGVPVSLDLRVNRSTARPRIDVVFLTDLSRSMSTYCESGSWRCSGFDTTPGYGLQAALKAAINTLFTQLSTSTILRVGLEDFADGSGKYSVPLTSNTSTLNDMIDDYKTYGGTQTAVGVQTAKSRLDTGGAVDKKIMIIMSDGAPTNNRSCSKNIFCEAADTWENYISGADYSPLNYRTGDYCYPNSCPSGGGQDILTPIKTAGVEIYSAAFGGAVNMNSWSSNSLTPAPGKNCDDPTGYCFSSVNDLAILYDTIVKRIKASMAYKTKVSFNWTGGSSEIDLDNNATTTVNLNLPASACGQPLTATVSGLTTPLNSTYYGTLKVFGNLQYCAPVAVGQKNPANSQVAGAFESRNLMTAWWQGIIGLLQKIWPSSLISHLIK